MINLFKDKEGFNPSTFTGLVKNGVEQIPDEIKDKLIQVDEETYNKLQNHELMWKDGELVSNPDYEEYSKQLYLNELKKSKVKEINRLKSLLSETDYRALKYFEGYYTEEEYAPYKAQRQAYRDEINQLEKELEALN